MADVQDWQSLSTRTSAKLGETEAKWNTAKDELAALKDLPQVVYPPGIDGIYARLSATSGVLKSRNAILARFQHVPLWDEYTLAIALLRTKKDRRSTETITGTLIRTFEATQEWIDWVALRYDNVEVHIDETLEKLRKGLETICLHGQLCAATSRPQVHEALTLHVRSRREHAAGDKEALDRIDTAEAKYRAGMQGASRGLVDAKRCMLVVLSEVAEFGTHIGSQRLITEFVNFEWPVSIGGEEARLNAGFETALERIRRERTEDQRQTKITRFFKPAAIDLDGQVMQE